MLSLSGLDHSRFSSTQSTLLPGYFLDRANPHLVLALIVLTTTVFLRRTYGERSFGLKAFLTLAIVATIGFTTARDPENVYALSWFGPLFVLLWIGFFIFHRAQIAIRKLKKQSYIYSRTDGNPWLPWAVIPGVKTWANGVGGYSIITGWLDPAIVLSACWFATKFIGDQFAVMLLISGFSIFLTYQMKSYFEREKFLDDMDAQIEAEQRLAMTAMLTGGAAVTVDGAQGFVVVGQAPAPKMPGFLKNLPSFARPTSQPVDELAIPELRQDPPTAETVPGETRRTVAAPVAAPPAEDHGAMVAALDPALRNLVTAPPPPAELEAPPHQPEPPLPPSPVATTEPTTEPTTEAAPVATGERQDVRDPAAAPAELTERLDARLLKTIAEARSPAAAAAIDPTKPRT